MSKAGYQKKQAPKAKSQAHPGSARQVEANQGMFSDETPEVRRVMTAAFAASLGAGESRITAVFAAGAAKDRFLTYPPAGETTKRIHPVQDDLALLASGNEGYAGREMLLRRASRPAADGSASQPPGKHARSAAQKRLPAASGGSNGTNPTVCSSTASRAALKRPASALGVACPSAAVQAAAPNAVASAGLWQQLVLRGLNVQYPFSQLILHGLKSVEARRYPLGHRKIATAGEELFLIETPGQTTHNALLGDMVLPPRPETARIVGTIVFSADQRYDSTEDFRQDAGAHRIKAGAKGYDWTGEGNMYAWRLARVRPCRPLLDFGGKGDTGFGPRALEIEFLCFDDEEAAAAAEPCSDDGDDNGIDPTASSSSAPSPKKRPSAASVVLAAAARRPAAHCSNATSHPVLKRSYSVRSFEGGCPFPDAEGEGGICGKQRRQIAEVDGEKYCKLHAISKDNRPKEKTCPFVDPLRGPCTRQKRSKPEFRHKGIAYCQKHAKQMKNRVQVKFVRECRKRLFRKTAPGPAKRCCDWREGGEQCGNRAREKYEGKMYCFAHASVKSQRRKPCPYLVAEEAPPCGAPAVRRAQRDREEYCGLHAAMVDSEQHDSKVCPFIVDVAIRRICGKTASTTCTTNQLRYCKKHADAVAARPFTRRAPAGEATAAAVPASPETPKRKRHRSKKPEPRTCSWPLCASPAPHVLLTRSYCARHIHTVCGESLAVGDLTSHRDSEVFLLGFPMGRRRAL